MTIDLFLVFSLIQKIKIMKENMVMGIENLIYQINNQQYQT